MQSSFADTILFDELNSNQPNYYRENYLILLKYF